MQDTQEELDDSTAMEDMTVGSVLDEVSDRWIFVIMREAFAGVRRFDGFQAGTGASPNILSGRLKRLVAMGILERHPYQDRPTRYEYRLTKKGAELYPPIILLMGWADRWAGECDRPPLRLIHRNCGLKSRPHAACDQCGEPITMADMLNESDKP